VSEHRWAAHIKGEPGHFEVSVCHGKPSASWGWFGPSKLRIESSGYLAQALWRAQQIADALNAAGYDPEAPPPASWDANGSTI
jgi:hypothetical protein